MLEFQERRKIRKLVYSPLVAVAVLGLAFFMMHSVWRLYVEKYRVSSESLYKTESEYGAVRERREALEQELQFISTERGREEVIRSTYQMAKPGEVLVQLIDDRSSTAAAAFSEPRYTWWQRFVRMIE